MKTSDFDYHLPVEFIAQNPAFPRDHSKLMVYDCKHDRVFHRRFYEIGEYLGNGDVLVLNRSKVIPARIIFSFKGAEKEIFLLKKIADGRYQALVRPGRSFKPGDELSVDGELGCRVLEILEDGSRILQFRFSGAGSLDKKLHDLGRMPLPPYITSSSADFSDYQTVYAREEGSRAAPTAGLHFTNELLDALRNSGVQIEEVLLHVGLGTFAPVTSEALENHLMHFEEYEMPAGTAASLNKALREGRRVVAVGTTSVRVLESVFDGKSGFSPGIGETDIFIYPGAHEWKVVSSMITNFHLPKSTLIMLVASFLESRGVAEPVKKILSLYAMARENNYRFFSFGDAMLII